MAIAERAGVAAGTLYRHFSSKEELFVEGVRSVCDREVQAMRTAPEENPVAPGDLRTPGGGGEGGAAVSVERDGPVTTVLLSRPGRGNAVDGMTAEALASAFRQFDADPEAAVAVLHGEGGVFCAG